jgi:hypothetical protein
LHFRKALAVSLAIHLLLTGAYAINLGIKRCTRQPDPEAIFAELVPPSPAPPGAVEAPPHADRLAEKTLPAGDPGKPAALAPAVAPGPAAPEAVASQAMPELPAPAPAPATIQPPIPPAPAQPPPAAASPPPAAPAPAAVASAPADLPAPSPDNTSATAAAAGAAPALDPVAAERARMHHVAVVSTAEFYRRVPGELTQFVNNLLAGGALLSQGKVLVHMDVTPTGQIGRAHFQGADSPALLNRLSQVEWASTLPPRPLAACRGIHLRISVEGTVIRVGVELL